MDFDTLLPDLIFAAAQEQGLTPTGALLPLNSYENRVYEIGIDDAPPVIAKFYRANRWSDEQILEEHRFALTLAEAEVPCVPPSPLKRPCGTDATLGKIGGYRYAFFPKFRGREEPDLSDDHRRWLGRTLARLHNAAEHFSARHRVQIDPETYGYAVLERILSQPYIPEGLVLPLEAVLLNALELVDARYRAGVLIMPIHGDCHLGNVLWNKDGPHLVDFDDMVIGPPVQDVWMLFSGDENEVERQREAFFEGYETFRRFERSTLELTETLRTLRIICHAGWVGQRFEEPAFQRAFPYYREPRYWEGLLLSLKEQIALMQG